jgi:hypothetical protein
LQARPVSLFGISLKRGRSAAAVVKGREQKQARSDDAKRKILIGAYLLKKHDNDIKKLLEQNPDFIGYIRENDKHLFS